MHGFVDGKGNEGFAGSPGDDFSGAPARRRRAPISRPSTPPTTARASASAWPRRTRCALYKGRALAIPPGTPTGLDSFRLPRSRRRHRGAPGAARLLRLRSQRDVRRRGAAVGRARSRARRPAGSGRSKAHARGGVRRAVDDASAGRSVADARVSTRALELVAFGAALAWAGGDELDLLGRARVAAVRHLRRGEAAGAGARRRRRPRSSTTRPSRSSRRCARRCRSPRRPTAKGRC